MLLVALLYFLLKEWIFSFERVEDQAGMAKFEVKGIKGY